MNQRPILLRKRGATAPQSFWSQLARKAPANLALVLVDAGGQPVGGWQNCRKLTADEAAALLKDKRWEENNG